MAHAYNSDENNAYVHFWLCVDTVFFLRVNLHCVHSATGLSVVSSLCVNPQASVSLKRLRVFLSHEELQEDSVEHEAVPGWVFNTALLSTALVCRVLPLPRIVHFHLLYRSFFFLVSVYGGVLSYSMLIYLPSLPPQPRSVSPWWMEFSAGPELNRPH